MSTAVKRIAIAAERHCPGNLRNADRDRSDQYKVILMRTRQSESCSRSEDSRIQLFEILRAESVRGKRIRSGEHGAPVGQAMPSHPRKVPHNIPKVFPDLRDERRALIRFPRRSTSWRVSTCSRSSPHGAPGPQAVSGATIGCARGAPAEPRSVSAFCALRKQRISSR